MEYKLAIRNNIGFLSFGDGKKNLIEDPSLFPSDEVFGKIMAANLKALIIHGIGRNFSAGADLKFLDQEQNQNLKEDLRLGNGFLYRLERLNIPVVAAVNGVCFGGGLELALACHMRIANKKSLYAFPEINYDLIPGLDGARRLFTICGNQSMELLLSGDMINAEKAKEINLIDTIVESDAVEESYSFLNSLVQNKDIRAIQAIMEVINTSRFASKEEALELETNLFCSLVEHKLRKNDR